MPKLEIKKCLGIIQSKYRLLFCWSRCEVAIICHGWTMLKLAMAPDIRRSHQTCCQNGPHQNNMYWCWTQGMDRNGGCWDYYWYVLIVIMGIIPSLRETQQKSSARPLILTTLAPWRPVSMRGSSPMDFSMSMIPEMVQSTALPFMAMGNRDERISH